MPDCWHAILSTAEEYAQADSLQSFQHLCNTAVPFVWVLAQMHHHPTGCCCMLPAITIDAPLMQSNALARILAAVATVHEEGAAGLLLA